MAQKIINANEYAEWKWKFSFRAVSISWIPLGESYNFVGYTKIMIQVACEHSWSGKMYFGATLPSKKINQIPLETCMRSTGSFHFFR